jgi:hypothetical protein
MSGERFPVTITVQPWFRDHFFAGKIILPAVETMLLLAARVDDAFPSADIRVMEDMRFAKFLELPPEATRVEALLECAPDKEGKGIEAKLLTRIPCGKMSRIKEHGQVFFPHKGSDCPSSAFLQVDPAPPTGSSLTEITAEQLYRELVPFGPQYQTLRGILYLTRDSAWGSLKAPLLPSVHAVQEQIGSPFPLDGAMHAACVLGQQGVNFIPFPVAIDRRVILRPTRPGGEYLTRVSAVARTEEELVFDLLIFDRAGEVYETVSGLRMRDVGG